MPFNAPDPALVKIEALDMSRSDKDRIRWQNAAALERNKPAFGAGNAIPGSGALSQGGVRKGA